MPYASLSIFLLAIKASSCSSPYWFLFGIGPVAFNPKLWSSILLLPFIMDQACPSPCEDTSWSLELIAREKGPHLHSADCYPKAVGTAVHCQLRGEKSSVTTFWWCVDVCQPVNDAGGSFWAFLEIAQPQKGPLTAFFSLILTALLCSMYCHCHYHYS